MGALVTMACACPIAESSPPTARWREVTVDLVDMATYVVNSWLTLQDARLSARKREIARVYVAEVMPQLRAKVATIQGIDPAVLNAKEMVLASSF